LQACLNAPEGFGPDGQPLSGPVAATKAKNGGLAIRPHKLTAAASAAMAASAQAASNAQAEDQHHSASDGQNNLGHGTPNSRPKKRLPSGKGKKPQMGDIPPVPTIPEIHRDSPHNTPTMMTLQSPYGIPQEHYHHPHHQSPGQFYQPPPHSPGQGDYGGYYGGHPGYMMHQQQTPQSQGQGPLQGQGGMQQGQMQGGQGGQGTPIYGDSRGRMMMEGGRNLGMGYVGPGGQTE